MRRRFAGHLGRYLQRAVGQGDTMLAALTLTVGYDRGE
jgi:hypothetical protein